MSLHFTVACLTFRFPCSLCPSFINSALFLLFHFTLTEPLHHLPPSSTPRDLPSPHSPLRRPDLQAVTNEWLSLTMDSSASTPARSRTTTPIPPTPPPLPSDLTPFVKPQGLKAPSPVASQSSLGLLPSTVSRAPPVKEERHSLGHTPNAFCQSPPPLPNSSFRSSLQYKTDSTISQTLHIPKPEVLFCTKPEPLKSPTQVPPWSDLNVQAIESDEIPEIELHVKDPYDELLPLILKDTSDHSADSHLLEISSSDTITTSTQSSTKPKTEDQPAVKPTAVTKATDSAGSIRLQVQHHSPQTIEPLSFTWGDQSETQNGQTVQPQRLPLVDLSGYTELFIVEEEEYREDPKEQSRGFSERLQVEQVESAGRAWCESSSVTEPCKGNFGGGNKQTNNI